MMFKPNSPEHFFPIEELIYIYFGSLVSNSEFQHNMYAYHKLFINYIYIVNGNIVRYMYRQIYLILQINKSYQWRN